MLLSEFKPTKKATKVVESRITEEPMEFGPETGNELYPAGYENDGRLILHVVTELLPRIKDDQMSLDVMKAVDAIEAGKGNKADIKTVMGVYKEADKQGITKKYKDAIGKFDQDYKDDDGEDDLEESDIDQIADVGKVYSKINKMKMDLVDKGMEPEDAQDEACEKYDCDPSMYDKYVEMKRDEREGTKRLGEAGGYYTQPVYDLIEKHGYEKVMHELLTSLHADVIQAFLQRAEFDESVNKGRYGKKKYEAVGTAADPIMDLCDDVGCDPDHPIFQELVRYLDVDQIADFVSDYRRNYDMPNGMDDENLLKSEGNEFSGKRQAAIDAGKDEFEVGGKKYKVEAEHKFTKNSVTEEADDDAARELELYAENDESLYRQSYVPIAKNLSKKFKKGVYDSELAKKLWKYHADRAAQKYGMDHAGGSKEGLRMFSPDTRRAFARSLEDYWHDEMKSGNFMESAVTEYEGASQEDVAGAITHRFKMNTDLLSKALKKEGGIDALIMAIDDVAEWHAGAEELGSSDVSIMVREVMAQLGITERSLSGLRNSSAFDGKDRMMALLDKNKKLNDKEKEEERIKKATFGEGAMMVCKHCGDEMHKPTTNCECDCNDENGDHWITKESYTENQDKIVKEYKDAGYVTK